MDRRKILIIAGAVIALVAIVIGLSFGLRSETPTIEAESETEDVAIGDIFSTSVVEGRYRFQKEPVGENGEIAKVSKIDEKEKNIWEFSVTVNDKDAAVTSSLLHTKGDDAYVFANNKIYKGTNGKLVWETEPVFVNKLASSVDGDFIYASLEGDTKVYKISSKTGKIIKSCELDGLQYIINKKCVVLKNNIRFEGVYGTPITVDANELTVLPNDFYEPSKTPMLDITTQFVIPNTFKTTAPTAVGFCSLTRDDITLNILATEYPIDIDATFKNKFSAREVQMGENVAKIYEIEGKRDVVIQYNEFPFIYVVTTKTENFNIDIVLQWLSSIKLKDLQN